jgi:hypothetical protein
MTRLWVPGQPIRVKADPLGGPVSFSWRGKRHPVERVCSRWRIDQAWWTRHIWREYFKLTTKTGLLVIVYRDFVSGRWFLQKVYDTPMSHFENETG